MAMLLLLAALLIAGSDARWGLPEAPAVRDRLAQMPHERASAWLATKVSPRKAWVPLAFLAIAIPDFIEAVAASRGSAIGFTGMVVALFAADIYLEREARHKVTQAAAELKLTPSRTVMQGPMRTRRTRGWAIVAIAATLLVGLGLGATEEWASSAVGDFLVVLALPAIGLLVVSVMALVFTTLSQFDDDRPVLGPPQA